MCGSFAQTTGILEHPLTFNLNNLNEKKINDIDNIKEGYKCGLDIYFLKKKMQQI